MGGMARGVTGITVLSAAFFLAACGGADESSRNPAGVGPDGLAAFSVRFVMKDVEQILQGQQRFARILVTKRDPRTLEPLGQDRELTAPLPRRDVPEEPSQPREVKGDKSFTRITVAARFFLASGEVSPDRSQIAVVAANHIWLVKAADLRVRRHLRLGCGYCEYRVRWIDARRFAAVRHDGQVTFVDARTTSRHHTNGFPAYTERVAVVRGLGVTFLLVPYKTRPMRLAFVNTTGDVWSIPLSRVVTRYREDRSEAPALAVDSQRLHAYVVTRRIIADVDLRRRETTYHSAPDPTRRRASDFGYYRRAFWLGGRRLAIAGGTGRFFATRRAGAFGAYVIDTKTWGSTPLDVSAGDLSYVARKLVVTSRGGISIRDAIGHAVQTVRDPCSTSRAKQPLVVASGGAQYVYVWFVSIGGCNRLLAIELRGPSEITQKLADEIEFPRELVIARGG